MRKNAMGAELEAHTSARQPIVGSRFIANTAIPTEPIHISIISIFSIISIISIIIIIAKVQTLEFSFYLLSGQLPRPQIYECNGAIICI